MPQITLECSDNVKENDLLPLLTEIHQILAEKLPTDLSSCKSRLMRYPNYVVGNAEPHNAFVHLNISVLKGRSVELLDSIAAIIMQNLKKAFENSLNSLNLQITIAIQNLPDVYQKSYS